MSEAKQARVEAYIGAGGSGKGVSIKRRLRELKPPRLLMWDPRNEYGEFAPAYDSLPYLVGAFKHAKGGPVRARYVPGGSLKLADAFALVCSLAFQAENLVLVAEELSDVTTASHAPPAWRRLCTQGRHQRMHILGAAQRPALIDKTFLANCTLIRCFQLGYDEDCRTMSKELRVPEAMVAAIVTDELPDGADIRYIERRRRAREWIAGRIVIRGGRVTEKAAPFDPNAAPT